MWARNAVFFNLFAAVEPKKMWQSLTEPHAIIRRFSDV